MLTVKELMAKYKVSRRTIYNWLDKGLPVTRIGSVVRFDPNKVEEWIEKQANREEE